MRSKFALFQLRELLLVVLPLPLIVLGAIWFALRFVDPAPPRTPSSCPLPAPAAPTIAMPSATGRPSSATASTSRCASSGGSLANLKALSDPASGVHAGFVQGGLASSKDTPGLLSVGRVAYEPLWVFYAGSARLERLTDLKGKRILVGPAGGGTSGLALRLLAANGITAETATLINRELPDYVDLLAKGEADAGFLVLAPEARTIQRLLRTPNVHLMSFANAEAYTQRFPFLSRLVLRQGVVDFAANIPPADTTLIATTAAVLVRAGCPPRARQPAGAGPARGARPADGRRERRGAAVPARRRISDGQRSRVRVVRGRAPRLSLGPAGAAALHAVLGRHHGRPPDGVVRGAAADPDPAAPVCAADLQLAHPPPHHVLVRRAEAAGGGRQERIDSGGAGCETGRARPHRGGRRQHRRARSVSPTGCTNCASTSSLHAAA